LEVHGPQPGEDREPLSTYKPFTDLQEMLQRKTSRAKDTIDP
jgi:hypothetical protein